MIDNGKYLIPHKFRPEPVGPVWGDNRKPMPCGRVAIQTPRIKGATPKPDIPGFEIRPPVGSITRCSRVEFPQPKTVWVGPRGSRRMVKDLPVSGSPFAGTVGAGLIPTSGSGGTIEGVGGSSSGASASVRRRGQGASNSGRGGTQPGARALPVRSTILQLSLGSPTIPGGVAGPPNRKRKA